MYVKVGAELTDGIGQYYKQTRLRVSFSSSRRRRRESRGIYSRRPFRKGGTDQVCIAEANFCRLSVASSLRTLSCLGATFHMWRFRTICIHGVVLGLSFLTSAHAADYYVRDGGTSSTCSDWSNACDALPATLQRGSTYYVADGSYPGYIFDDANSGTQTITVKKATVADHGTNTGWNSSYGDGQAIFGGDFVFVTDYYTIDGQTRNESSWSAKSSYGISIPGVTVNSASFGQTGDNVTLRYLDIGPDDGTSNKAGYGGAVIYFGGFTDIAENWVVEKNYIHNGRAMVQHAGVHNMLYQYNWFAKNWEKTAIRGQIRASSVVIRFNVFKDTCQGNSLDVTATSCTAITGWYGNSGSNNEDYSNSKVYGNLMWDSIGTVAYTNGVIWMGDDRSTQGGGLQNCSNCAVYNNTFVGLGKQYRTGDFGNCTVGFSGIKTNTEARNNLWYDVSPLCTTGCSAAACSNNTITSNGGFFLNAAGGDFHLTSKGAAGAGYALSAPYNLDLDGKARGAGGWDVGAYEYGGSVPAEPVPPAPPTNLTATVQ